MSFMDIFKKLGKGQEEEVVEFPEEVTEGEKKVTVRIETLENFIDAERVARLLRDGNIVFLKVGDLQKKDLGEFQNCVQKLKRLCSQGGWDIVGVEEGYLVLTPTFAKIERS
jgi:SepF-like predicted cell division protein (DUF552 family)